MRIATLVAATAALMITTQAASSAPEIPAEAAAKESQLLAKIGPQTRAWVRQEAARQAARGTPSEAGAVQAVRANPALGKLGDGDILSLAFLVLMEAAKSAREDLKAIMDGVKRINDAKATARRPVARGGDAEAPRVASSPAAVAGPRSASSAPRAALEPRPLPRSQFDAQLGRARNDVDALNEMGEMESLRLQMAMVRRSKMMATLSNVLKKMSDTAAGITQNLK